MERRNFLRGVFGGVAAGGLILKATDADVAHFASGLGMGSPVEAAYNIKPGIAELGNFVYDHKGAILGVISDFHYQRGVHQWESWDGTSGAVPGLINASLTVQVMGPITIGPSLGGGKAR